MVFNFPEVSLDPIAQPVGVDPELECMPVYSHSKDSGSGIPTVQRHACPPSNHEPSAHLMGSARRCDPFLRVRFTHGPRAILFDTPPRLRLLGHSESGMHHRHWACDQPCGLGA